MYMTQLQPGLRSRDCINYRGYYIITNHDDSKMAVTADLKTILLQTASLCGAYAFIDNLIDSKIKQ